jgi:hypothetical protein
VDDEGDEAIADYDREDDDENIEYRELDIDRLVLEASQVDTTGICTVAAERNNKPQDSSQVSELKHNSEDSVPGKIFLHFLYYCFKMTRILKYKLEL